MVGWLLLLDVVAVALHSCWFAWLCVAVLTVVMLLLLLILFPVASSNSFIFGLFLIVGCWLFDKVVSYACWLLLVGSCWFFCFSMVLVSLAIPSPLQERMAFLETHLPGMREVPGESWVSTDG